MEDVLKSLGVTKEVVLSNIASQVIDEYRGSTIESMIDDAIRKELERLVGDAVSAVFNGSVNDVVIEKLEALTFKQTNCFGERKGETLTLREKLMCDAKTWLDSDVDRMTGKPARNGITRLSYMVGNHLDVHIKSAIKTVVSEANSQFSNGIVEECKKQLKSISERIDVSIRTLR